MASTIAIYKQQLLDLLEYLISYTPGEGKLAEDARGSLKLYLC